MISMARPLLILVAAWLAICAAPGVARADAMCAAGAIAEVENLPVTGTLEEGSSECFFVAITDATFAQTANLFMFEPGPILIDSDIATAQNNILGTAIICFASDPDVGECPALTNPSLAVNVIESATESTLGQFVVPLSTPAGQSLLISFTSDADLRGELSDTFSVAVAPEPPTLTLSVMGFLTLLVFLWWRRAKAS